MAILLSDYESGPKLDGDYAEQLAAVQERLTQIQIAYIVHRRRAIVMFEGWDASGKGGTIQRLTSGWDARYSEVWPIKAPTPPEKARHFLWRFWTKLPADGHIHVFDRSWYGRVLVERVEGFCAEADWLRAYTEINDFEHELQKDGAIVVKFWLQISADEQLKRFKEREKIAFKRFKITEEDWRNRKKSRAYHAAVCDMVDRTSTTTAPWTLVEANDKNFARVKILRTICERLEEALGTGKSQLKEK